MLCTAAFNTSIDISCPGLLAVPAVRCCSGRWLRETDGRTSYRYIHPAAYYASSVNENQNYCSLNTLTPRAI